MQVMMELVPFDLNGHHIVLQIYLTKDLLWVNYNLENSICATTIHFKYTPHKQPRKMNLKSRSVIIRLRVHGLYFLAVAFVGTI